MRFIIGLAAALAVAGLGASLLYAAEDMQSLKRKPGLWEIVTVAPVSGMTKTRVCVGENDNLVMPDGADCTEPKLTPLNEGVTVDLVCTNEQGKQTISTTFTGDFHSRYHATLKTSFEPPIGGIPHMGVKLDGKYLGPDCDGAGNP